uniref:CHAD domain-containing protein n=1 Tax=Gluconobacter thailandicus TaxID=257438 RepID=UPI000A515C56|nr:CHAD domain-containing protein [Gluconobacter thailandicus]
MIRNVMPVRLTFRFLPEAWPAIRHHAAIAACLKNVRPRHRIWTFYDTPAADVSLRGYALCTGRNGRQSVQKLQPVLWTGLPGASSSECWIWFRKGLRPDPGLLNDTPLVDVDLETGLLPIYRSDFWELQGQQRTGENIIQITLSRGSVQAGKHSETVCMVDFVLKEGLVASLYEMAKTLANLPVWLTGESIPMQGARLANAQHLPLSIAKARLSTENVTVGMAWTLLVRSALTSFLLHQALTERGDVEGVHQIRMAIRRLRTVLRFFRPLLPKKVFLKEAVAFQKLGRRLGEVRDWDVFVTEILPNFLEPVVAEPFKIFAENRSLDARTEMHQRLTDPSVTAAILSLGASAEKTDDLFGADVSSSLLEDHAPEFLDRMARKVQHRGAHISRLSDEHLHDVRKALKGLRYSVDSVVGIYSGKRLTAYIKHCKDLQEVFGQFNDFTMAERLVEQAMKDAPDLEGEGQAILDAAHHAKKKILKKLPKKWKAFSKSVPFWC